MDIMVVLTMTPLVPFWSSNGGVVSWRSANMSAVTFTRIGSVKGCRLGLVVRIVEIEC